MNDAHNAMVRREMARWRADHSYMPRFTDLVVTQDEDDPTLVTIRMMDTMPIEGAHDPVPTDTDPAPPPVVQSVPPPAKPVRSRRDVIEEMAAEGKGFVCSRMRRFYEFVKAHTK